MATYGSNDKFFTLACRTFVLVLLEMTS